MEAIDVAKLEFYFRFLPGISSRWPRQIWLPIYFHAKKKNKKNKKNNTHKAQNFSIWIRLSSKGIYISQKNGLRSFSLHRIGLKVKILKFSLHGMGLKAQNCPLHGMSSKPENLFLNVMDLRAKVFTSWNGLKSPKLPATSNELKARKFIP